MAALIYFACETLIIPLLQVFVYSGDQVPVIGIIAAVLFQRCQDLLGWQGLGLLKLPEFDRGLFDLDTVCPAAQG
jgi:hypothetical protein